jgi:hypothetical protein
MVAFVETGSLKIPWVRIDDWTVSVYIWNMTDAYSKGYIGDSPPKVPRLNGDFCLLCRMMKKNLMSSKHLRCNEFYTLSRKNNNALLLFFSF